MCGAKGRSSWQQSHDPRISVLAHSCHGHLQFYILPLLPQALGSSTLVGWKRKVNQEKALSRTQLGIQPQARVLFLEVRDDILKGPRHLPREPWGLTVIRHWDWGIYSTSPARVRCVWSWTFSGTATLLLFLPHPHQNPSPYSHASP